MHWLNFTFSISLGICASFPVDAVLQMHVFETEATKPTTPSINDSANDKELVLAHKHGLQMHIFDAKTNMPINKNAVRIAEQQNQTPIFTYQDAEFYFNTGYRQDDLNWSIAGIGGTPNILSELKWVDIEIATFNFGSTLYLKSNWLVNMDLVYGRIYAGKNQDSDYNGDNRTLEFSRSNNNADQGDILEFSGSFGYRWRASINQQHIYPNLELRPQLGLSYHSQNLKAVDGYQTIPASGAFAGLDSNYDATWFGPWLGVDSRINFSEKFSVALNLEYHHIEYDASANWNLRPDFAHPESFTHEAVGYGLVGSVSSQLQLNNKLSLNLSVDYQDWQAHRNGIDTTYFSNGTSLTTKFNGVNWRSFGANLGLIYEF